MSQNIKRYYMWVELNKICPDYLWQKKDRELEKEKTGIYFFLMRKMCVMCAHRFCVAYSLLRVYEETRMIDE